MSKRPRRLSSAPSAKLSSPPTKLDRSDPVIDPSPGGPAYVYRATARRVTDGDTFVADVDLGFGVSAAIKVRVRGVNAPEHAKPGGPEATDFLSALLRAPVGRKSVELPTDATALLLASYHDEQSFIRWVCDVWLPSGQALAEAIVTSGHGVYFDPSRDHWTP